MQLRSIGVVDEETDLRSLYGQVHRQHAQPEDVYEVAAIIESLGWNDARVQQRLGYADVFDVARRIWRMKGNTAQAASNEFVEKVPRWRALGDTVRQFLRGLVFALPMVLSMIAMLTLHFSLWSYQYLSVNSATAIAIATILSFLTVGGFMQAIARRAFFYIFQQYYKMAQRVTFRYIRNGIITSLIISMALIGLNVLFPVFPFTMLVTAIAFYMVMNAIWLSVTVMYVLKKEIFFTGLFAGGIGLVWVGFHEFHMNILVSQLAAMLITSVLGLTFVYYLFRTSPNRLERGFQPSLPRPGVTVYSTLPYFVYGFLYFLLLFVDRMMAWSTHSDFSQYMIWFRGDYEVGLDFALSTLIIPLGLMEVIVTRMMNRAVLAQREYFGGNVQDLNQRFVKDYRHGMMWMVFTATGSAVLVYLGVKWLLDHYLSTLPQSISLTATSDYVFIVGLVSYTILSIALVNAVTMFSLNRPELVIRPLLLAVVVNLITGFLLSRWFGYADAVWGIFTGSTLFAYLTTKNMFLVLREFDYHLYLLS